MNAKIRFAEVIVILVLCRGVTFGEEFARDPLKSALYDLTTNIEKVDDAGFSRACDAMGVVLSGVPASSFEYPPEFLVWKTPGQTSFEPRDLFTVAFAAGVAQELIYGEPKLALYRGWLNVIKYYRHYHGEGSVKRIAAIEEFDRLEKKGTLQAQAQELEAKHPALFERLEIDPSLRDTTNKRWWEGCGVIAADWPTDWSFIGKNYGDRTFIFTASPRTGGHAEMTLILMQHQKVAGEASAVLTRKLQQAVSGIIPQSVEITVASASLKMREGSGLLGEFDGTSLANKSPVKIKHRLIRVAECALDDHCDLTAVMQMDAPDSAEAAQMLSVVQSVVLLRSQPSSILDIEVVAGNYVLSVPVAKLSLSFPQGKLVNQTASFSGNASSRYFCFTDTTRTLIVTGWFESDRDYNGIRDFWKSENQGNRLGATNVSFEKPGQWDAIFYDVPIPAIAADGKKHPEVKSLNLRAEYAKAGTWLDLHCSITSDRPSKESRAALTTFLETLKVEEK